MAALQVPGHLTWSIPHVLASVILGLLLGTAALSVASRRDDTVATHLAGALLTLAIVSHHFTAMGAIALTPDSTRVIDALTISELSLAITVGG